MAIHEYMLSHKELVKAILVYRNIHEGFWCLNINFNIAASHGVESPNPSVALSIMSIGIMQSAEANELTVDAAVVNPWRAKLVEPVQPAQPAVAPEPPPSPKPAEPIIASNAQLLASLPSRFSRNIYGNVAVSFRPGTAPQGLGSSNGMAHAGSTVNGGGLNGGAPDGAGANGPVSNAAGANGVAMNGAPLNGAGANGTSAHAVAAGNGDQAADGITAGNGSAAPNGFAH